MTTSTKSCKPTKSSRFVRVLSRLDAEGKGGEIEISATRGKKTEVCRYRVDRMPADFGTAFRLEKHGDGATPDVYAVNIDPAHATCDCPGHSHWGKCKHVDCLAKLCELGKL